ncbi:MAG: phosphate/phosphite/phosphonate ABC transporter substrate-binding protein [Desulfobacteraceae bacterium]|mgnify:CR=1 FL=1|nr:MAG: phosphate/phosphite/phosphonate ABC transporter substrate-binding protein [Desulfobacteraceae bacterium]
MANVRHSFKQPIKLRHFLTSLILIICMSIGVFTRIDQADASDAVTQTGRSQPAMNFGVERFADEKIMDQAFTPLLQYLEEQLNQPFIINYFSNDDEITRHLTEGRLQIAHFSSMAYARSLMTNQPYIQYIATVSDSNSTPSDHYRGYIFTRRENPETTLIGLKGQTFAFVNITSSSGFSYPLMMFLKAGIDPKTFFARTLFLGDHPSVTTGVINKTVYAGATYDGNYNSADKSAGGTLKIIAQTPPIPNEPWVAGKGVTQEFIQQLRDLLVAMDPTTKTANGILAVSKELQEELEVDSFTLRDSSFYDVVIDMLRFTGEYKW